MAIDFGILERTPSIASRFMAGQEAAQAEQERNVLRQMRAEQMQIERENALLTRQKTTADLAAAQQRRAALDKVAAVFRQQGKTLDLQSLNEAMSWALESGSADAVKQAEGLRNLFLKQQEDALIFGLPPSGAAPAVAPAVAPVVAPTTAAPVVAPTTAAPAAAPVAVAPEPMPEMAYTLRAGEVSPGGAVSAGVAPPAEVRLSAYGRGAPAAAPTPAPAPAGEINTAAWRAMAPVVPPSSELPVNALAPEPAAAPAVNAMVAPAAEPSVQVAGPAALPTAAPKTFEYGGRTYTSQQIQAMQRSERYKDLAKAIIEANKPTSTQQDMVKFGFPLTAAGLAAFEAAKRDPDTVGMKEYNLAVKQGFQGTLLQFKKELAEAGRPKVDVRVSTEKQYGEQFGGLVAKTDEALLRAAQDAPAQAENANRILSTLATGKAITGPLADVKLSIARALNVVGADNADTISKTESLVTSMAENTLNAIKTSGLGTGQGFTNKDLEFLEKAKSGNINFQPDTIRQLAELAHRAAEKTAEKWSTRVKQIPKSALEGTGVSTEPIAVPKRASSVTAGARPSGVGTDWTLMQDANGKKAWVSPDRKQVKEVD